MVILCTKNGTPIPERHNTPTAAPAPPCYARLMGSAASCAYERPEAECGRRDFCSWRRLHRQQITATPAAANTAPAAPPITHGRGRPPPLPLSEGGRTEPRTARSLQSGLSWLCISIVSLPRSTNLQQHMSRRAATESEEPERSQPAARRADNTHLNCCVVRVVSNCVPAVNGT